MPAKIAAFKLPKKIELNPLKSDGESDIKSDFKPVYTISGSPEEVKEIRDQLTKLNIPFREPEPQNAMDEARFGKRETLVIEATAIEKYLPQTGMTVMEATTSRTPKQQVALEERLVKQKLDTNRDGKIDMKDFDRNGDGKLTLSDFSEKDAPKAESAKALRDKFDKLSKLTSTPELQKIRDTMMAIAQENNIPLNMGDSPLTTTLPSTQKGERGK